jgi:hypothetical protein
MNRESDSFKNGHFTWFTGVVEEINDPDYLGRVKVRCFGYHTNILANIATTSLPWATVMGPTNSANVSGIGTTTHGLVNGTWVVGFFRDGPSAQDPIIMGTVGSSYAEKPSSTLGFSDASGTYPKFQQDTDGTDLEETYVDTNLLARGTNTIIRELDTVSKEPATLYAAVYPNNKVTQTTSGHIIEIDDTPGAERINVRHMSGTFVEIHPNGDVVQSNSNKYQITTGDDNVHITGVCNLTIDSHCNTTIGGDWNINVTGNKNETIGGEVVETYSKSKTTKITDNIVESVGGSVTESYSGSQKTSAASMDINGGSAIDMDAGRIDLN